ncbi:hypothetical protein [Bremerella cremea]|uniref:hypothetical protein n=1 Tax=Bremerella cremea TaxID=1031537 RepID=UPI0031EDA44F
MKSVNKILRENPSFVVGAEAARNEIADDRLGWREHGKIVPWWNEAADQLSQRYAVHFSFVGECITPIDVAAEAAGYNEEMEAEFARRFGANVVEEVFRELERKKKKQRHR